MVDDIRLSYPHVNRRKMEWINFGNVCFMFVHVRFVLCLRWDWFGGLIRKNKSFKYQKSFEM